MERARSDLILGGEEEEYVSMKRLFCRNPLSNREW